MYKSFTDMEVWQDANRLSLQIFQLSSELPRSEDYGLTSQIRRSANSISANLAEGFGRKTKRDKANFYIIARGSAFETQSHLLYGMKVGYFEDDATKETINEYGKLIHGLNKLIKSLT